jgi:hypothetical protein
MPIKEQDCVQALKEASAKLEKSPSKRDYRKLDIEPSVSSIQRVVGSWGEAKEKAGVEAIPKGERGGNEPEPKPDDIENTLDESWEDLSPRQRWYLKNKEDRIQRANENRARHLQWFRNYKKDLECEECGEDHPATLHFHHLDSEEKEMAVGEMPHRGYSKERIKEEMEKCRVLCANCHIKEHSK